MYTWKSGTWLLFSDEHMQTIGPSFADNVLPHCIANTYQPVLLFYENKRALNPRIVEETAPQQGTDTSSTVRAPVAQPLTSASRIAKAIPAPLVAPSASSSAAGNNQLTPRRERIVIPAAPQPLYNPTAPYAPAASRGSFNAPSTARQPVQGTHYAPTAQYAPGGPIAYGPEPPSYRDATDANYHARLQQMMRPAAPMHHVPLAEPSAYRRSIPDQAVHEGQRPAYTRPPITTHRPLRLGTTSTCLSCKGPNTSVDSYCCTECWQRPVLR